MQIRTFFKNNIWLALMAALLLGLFAPGPGRYLAPYAEIFLIIMMFVGSLNIRLEAIRNNLKNPKKLALAYLIIFLAEPLILMPLRPYMPEGVYPAFLLTGIMATGVSIVFFSGVMGGSPSLALVIVSLTNLSSPLLVPLLLKVFLGESVELDYLQMFIKLMTFILIPVSAAFLIRKTPLYHPVHHNAPFISSGAVFFMIWGVISPLSHRIKEDPVFSLQISFTAILMFLFMFMAGWLLGRTKEEKVTLGMSFSFRNLTLAMVTALLFFPEVVHLPAIIITLAGNVYLAGIQAFFRPRE